MRTMMVLSLLTVGACATDAGDENTSTDVLESTVVNDCATGATGDVVNATSSVAPLQYDLYERDYASVNDPNCRADTVVEFTVHNAPGPVGVKFHSFVVFGSDPFHTGGFTKAMCENSSLRMQIYRQDTPGHWISIWGPATGPGQWDADLRYCSRVGGDNSPVVLNGVYRVHALGTIDGGPEKTWVDIYAGTRPPPQI